jgi:hypothetical protein
MELMALMEASELLEEADEEGKDNKAGRFYRREASRRDHFPFTRVPRVARGRIEPQADSAAWCSTASQRIDRLEASPHLKIRRNLVLTNQQVISLPLLFED